MGIKAKFKTDDVFRAMESRRTEIGRLIIRNLAYVGEHAVKIAREAHAMNYTDRTGNLRSSVGYVIVKDGRIVSSGGFDPAAASGEKGAKEGRAFAEQLAKRYTKGYVLIVVAGMYYGTYVEKREYNVVTFTKIEAEKMAKEVMGNFF
jgi:hypothetical protein